MEKNTKITFSLPSPWVFTAYTIALGLIVGFHKPIYNWTDVDWLIVGIPIIIEMGICICFILFAVVIGIISSLVNAFRK